MSDFEKILRDAKELSEAIHSSGGNAPGNLFGNMAQITNMMDIIKSFRSVGHVPEAPPAPVALPGVPVSNNVAALMAMAPFMGETNRKNVIIASKLMELLHIVNNFEAAAHQTDEQTLTPMDNKNMLLAARPYIDPDKRDMVDLLITVMDISDILKKIERVNADADKF